MRQRRGDYGFDSPYVPLGLAAAAILGFGIAAILFAYSLRWLGSLSLVAAAVFVRRPYRVAHGRHEAIAISR